MLIRKILIKSTESLRGLQLSSANARCIATTSYKNNSKKRIGTNTKKEYNNGLVIRGRPRGDAKTSDNDTMPDFAMKNVLSPGSTRDIEEDSLNSEQIYQKITEESDPARYYDSKSDLNIAMDIFNDNLRDSDRKVSRIMNKQIGVVPEMEDPVTLKVIEKITGSLVDAGLYDTIEETIHMKIIENIEVLENLRLMASIEQTAAVSGNPENHSLILENPEIHRFESIYRQYRDRTNSQYDDCKQKRLKVARFVAPKKAYNDFLKAIYPIGTDQIVINQVYLAYGNLPSPQPLFIQPHDFEHLLSIFLRLSRRKDKRIFDFFYEVVRDMRSCKMPLSVSEQNSLIKLQLYNDQQRKIEINFETYENIKQSYMSRDISSSNILLAAAAQRGNVELVERIFEDLKAYELEPDRFTVCSMINFYGNKGDITSFVGTIENYMNKYSIDQTVFNIIINGFIRCGRFDAAETLFKHLLDAAKPSIGVVSYQDEKQQFHNRECRILDAISSACESPTLLTNRLYPNPFTFQPFLTAYAKRGGSFEEISAFLELMDVFKVPLLSDQYNRLFISFKTNSSWSLEDLNKISIRLLQQINEKKRALEIDLNRPMFINLMNSYQGFGIDVSKQLAKSQAIDKWVSGSDMAIGLRRLFHDSLLYILGNQAVYDDVVRKHEKRNFGDIEEKTRSNGPLEEIDRRISILEEQVRLRRQQNKEANELSAISKEMQLKGTRSQKTTDTDKTPGDVLVESDV